MIALDSSSFIAFLLGESGKDVEAVDMALEYEQAVLPPVVLAEVLSDPTLDEQVLKLLEELPVLDVLAGFWKRAGILRAKLISVGRRARLADALIAQTCVDHDVPLITRDSDFSNFARFGGLRTLPQ